MSNDGATVAKKREATRLWGGDLTMRYVPVALVSLVANFLMLAGPLYMLQVYDRVLASRSIPTLVTLTVLLGGIYVIYVLLEYARSGMLGRIAALFEARNAARVFRANALLPLRQKTSAGVQDPVRDLDIIRSVLASGGPAALFDLPWVPLYIGIVYLFHPWLGFFAAGGAVLLVLVMILNDFLSRAPLRDTSADATARTQFSTNTRNNPGAVVGMGMLGNLTHIFMDRTSSLLGNTIKGLDRSSFFSSFTKGLRLAMQSGILGLGAYLAIQEEITSGAMIAASILGARAVAPVEAIIANWRSMIGAWQASGRLKETLQGLAKTEVVTELPLPKESLVIENLVSGPHPGAATVQGVSLKLQAGSGLGIIGPSGSGKTTIARAILGVWPVLAGSIRLDGSRSEQWDPDRLGQAIGYLPQEVDLFNGTVAQNIARFSPDAEDEDIVKAAKVAGAHQLISKLPNGYDTQIGEQDFALSAGQKQRVGLARALFRDPFLVVLDEPNANLDAEGDHFLSHAVASVRKRGGIVLVIAHRPSAIAAINLLLTVSNGRMQAFGPKQKILDELNKQAEVQKKRAEEMRKQKAAHSTGSVDISSSGRMDDSATQSGQKKKKTVVEDEQENS